MDRHQGDGIGGRVESIHIRHQGHLLKEQVQLREAVDVLRVHAVHNLGLEVRGSRDELGHVSRPILSFGTFIQKMPS